LAASETTFIWRASGKAELSWRRAADRGRDWRLGHIYTHFLLASENSASTMANSLLFKCDVPGTPSGPRNPSPRKSPRQLTDPFPRSADGFRIQVRKRIIVCCDGYVGYISTDYRSLVIVGRRVQDVAGWCFSRQTLEIHEYPGE
jgi:hypothetical protein